MASLDSPLAKFTRAKEQYDALSRDLLNLSDLESYVINKEVDHSTEHQIYRFESVPAIPNDLGLRIGEMLYNFRCSLDHLVWQLVLSEGNTPTIRNEFPIFNDITEYNRQKVTKLKGVSNAVIPIIDTLQPCNSTLLNDYWWYLWYLHELCNADKHRHLLLTRRTLGKKLRVNWTGAGVPKGVYLDAPVENGAVFFRVELKVDVNVKPTIQVFFSNSPSNIRTDLPVGNIISLIKGSVEEAFNRLRSHVK